MNTTNYERGLLEIQRLNSRLEESDFDYEREMLLAVKSCPSNLDAYDLAFSITIGILSAILDTNDKVADFLDEVHQLASKDQVDSENKIKECLAKVLHHTGDWIDKVPTDKLNKTGSNIKNYVSRKAKKAAEGVWESDAAKISGPHRIFWGHDIFSIHGDNPFSLLLQEYGIGRGILQAIRHLVADTCSKQGLVLPFSSYFDYVDVSVDHAGNATEKVKNKLLDFCQQYSSEALGKKQRGVDNEVFNHIFSIHLQDALSTGLVAAGIAAYSAGRKIRDEMRKVQMRVIGYMGVAYGSAIIGAAAHNGIPFINYPAFLALAKNIMQMLRISNKEIEKIIIETESLISEGDSIENREKALHKELVSDLHGTLACKTTNVGRDSLIDFLGEVK